MNSEVKGGDSNPTYPNVVPPGTENIGATPDYKKSGTVQPKSKLREIVKKNVIKWHTHEFDTESMLQGIIHGERCEKLIDDILSAFSEELDELGEIINVHKGINVDYHGREDCKSCSLMENLESAIKEMKGRIKNG